MKREETIAIEKVLHKSLFGTNPKLAKEYGTSEVDIGFQRDGKGKEFVDFISYNPKTNEFRCYEIKVTMQDFHSKAKKSWYGHYNYLVISEDLYNQQALDKWNAELPDGVGIIVVDIANGYKRSVKKAIKQFVSANELNMLKDSLLRTLFYQNQKKDYYLR